MNLTSAPQIDHKNYPAKLRKLDEAALRYIIKDCKEALQAMPENPKAGYYMDEIHYCCQELNRRNKKNNKGQK